MSEATAATVKLSETCVTVEGVTADALPGPLRWICDAHDRLITGGDQ